MSCRRTGAQTWTTPPPRRRVWWSVVLCLWLMHVGHHGASSQCHVVTIFGLKTADCNKQNSKTVPRSLDRDLQVLRFDENRLSYLGHEEFNPYHNLQEIYLARNRIEIVTPSAFQGLYSLQILDLEGNQLSVVPTSAFEPIRSLRMLSLKSNPIRRLDEISLAGLRNVEELNFENCWLESVHPRVFDGLAKLVEVNLVNNELRSLGAEMEFALPASLNVLRLYRNPWKCDCRLRWLRRWSTSSSTTVNWDFASNTPTCAAPELIRGVAWKHLAPEQFACPSRIVTPAVAAAAVTASNSSIGSSSGTSSSSSSRFRAVRGGNATLECLAIGDPEPVVRWTRGDDSPRGPEVGPASATAIVRREFTDEGERQVLSRLTLVGVAMDQAGDYKCTADNPAGRSEVTYKLWIDEVSGADGPPHDDASGGLLQLDRDSILGGFFGVVILVGIVVACTVCRTRYLAAACRRKKSKKHVTYKLNEYTKTGVDPVADGGSGSRTGGGGGGSTAAKDESDYDDEEPYDSTSCEEPLTSAYKVHGSNHHNHRSSSAGNAATSAGNEDPTRRSLLGIRRCVNNGGLHLSSTSSSRGRPNSEVIDDTEQTSASAATKNRKLKSSTDVNAAKVKSPTTTPITTGSDIAACNGPIKHQRHPTDNLSLFSSKSIITNKVSTTMTTTVSDTTVVNNSIVIVDGSSDGNNIHNNEETVSVSLSEKSSSNVDENNGTPDLLTSDDSRGSKPPDLTSCRTTSGLSSKRPSRTVSFCTDAPPKDEYNRRGASAYASAGDEFVGRSLEISTSAETLVLDDIVDIFRARAGSSAAAAETFDAYGGGSGDEGRFTAVADQQLQTSSTLVAPQFDRCRGMKSTSKLSPNNYLSLACFPDLSDDLTVGDGAGVEGRLPQIGIKSVGGGGGASTWHHGGHAGHGGGGGHRRDSVPSLPHGGVVVGDVIVDIQPSQAPVENGHRGGRPPVPPLSSSSSSSLHRKLPPTPVGGTTNSGLFANKDLTTPRKPPPPPSTSKHLNHNSYHTMPSIFISNVSKPEFCAADRRFPATTSSRRTSMNGDRPPPPPRLTSGTGCRGGTASAVAAPATTASGRTYLPTMLSDILGPPFGGNFSGAKAKIRGREASVNRENNEEDLGTTL